MNANASLFYLAFVSKDMDELSNQVLVPTAHGSMLLFLLFLPSPPAQRIPLPPTHLLFCCLRDVFHQLGVLLVMRMLLNNATEMGWPYVSYLLGATTSRATASGTTRLAGGDLGSCGSDWVMMG